MSGTVNLRRFFGWQVAWAAFFLAAFGWGIGFYSPPIFLHAVIERTGWPLPLVSSAVTVHFLAGAILVANLPTIYQRVDVHRVIGAGVVCLSLGILGWSAAAEPWQLFLASIMTGLGWVTMSAAGVNAVISRWFAKRRPAALAIAYNGASLGGAFFAPAWAYLISWSDFTTAAVCVCAVMVPVVLWLAANYFAPTPASLGQLVDGGEAAASDAPVKEIELDKLPGWLLWRDRAFVTLAGGMMLALFAQIGLVAHLFSVMVPALGEEGAGLTMGAATVMAVVGRFAVGWLASGPGQRRLLVALSIFVQIAGSVLFLVFGVGEPVLVVIAALLFGFGIGNVTLLPPLIAQAEFDQADVLRVVSLIIALSQGASAFAPSLLGAIRATEIQVAGIAGLAGSTGLFVVAVAIQALAVVCFLAGGRKNAGRIAEPSTKTQ